MRRWWLFLLSLCCNVISFRICKLKTLSLQKQFAEPTKERNNIASKILENASSDLISTNTRRKKGPPQRKQKYPNDNFNSRRVSVYCVGSAIDLSALRVHVFRRGFNPDLTPPTDGESIKNPDLVLSRGRENLVLDDEVLHVSNAPIYVSNVTSERILTMNNGDNKLETENGHNSDESNLSKVENYYETNRANESNETEDDEALMASTFWKTKNKEMLLMDTQDIFYFEYGCVVMWGLSSREEKAALTELQPFTVDPVSPEELEDSHDTMEFIFDRAANPQRPIKFDRIRLRSLRTEEKLSLSYAMAQSSKLFVFESKVLESVEMTRYLPRELAKEGRIRCGKRELNKLIGQLFVEQTEVNLFSSILDTPDFLWDDEEYVPSYQFARSYLEVDDRVTLLNSRLSVIRELLDVLNAQVADSNSARLEWIVIWLISIEIMMGIASSPLFVGKRVLTALLVPTAILLYKKVDWSDSPPGK